MFIHQTAYASNIVDNFYNSGMKPVCVPADPNSRLCQTSGNERMFRKVPFSETVGFLMFLTVVSRPDIP